MKKNNEAIFMIIVKLLSRDKDFFSFSRLTDCNNNNNYTKNHDYKIHILSYAAAIFAFRNIEPSL
jgi:hypothetical protein